ncbi:hypothetical protein Tco_1008964 [Tanacetum coccineum]
MANNETYTCSPSEVCLSNSDNKGIEVIKDKVSQEHVCEEEVLLNNNIGQQSGDLVEMPSEAVEQGIDDHVPDEIDGAKTDDAFTEDQRQCKEWVVYVISSITNVLDLKLPL